MNSAARTGVRIEPVLAPEPLIEIVVPVYNEEEDLEPSVRRLRAYLNARFPFPACVTIADNASTDATSAIGTRLARQLPGVRYIRLSEKGRGRAVAAAWLISNAGVVAYMDVDLSTDLDALLPLVAPLISGHSDLAIGSRLARGARIRRGVKRELISRAYNLCLRLVLGVRFSDAQCGFKAVSANVARRLLPKIENREWFFDTELLVLAERAGLRIHEVPVDWIDDPDSRVDIVKTAIEDMRGVWRLVCRRPPDRLLRFAGIGLLSTAAYAFLYLLLRGFTSAGAANAIALVVTAVANTAANRRFTFGVESRQRLAADYAAGLVALAAALLLTAATGGMLHLVAPNAGHLMEVVALTAANAVATICRYLLLRGWMDIAHVRINSWRTAE